MAVIAYRQARAAVFLRDGQRDARLRHIYQRILRIGQQVMQHLAQLVGVSQHKSRR